MPTNDYAFSKVNINTAILRSLKDGDKYGYEIAKCIQATTEEHLDIKQPTLYLYLKRLENSGHVASYWGTITNGGRRRYYKLTALGLANCECFNAEQEYLQQTSASRTQFVAEQPATPQQQAFTYGQQQAQYVQNVATTTVSSYAQTTPERPVERPTTNVGPQILHKQDYEKAFANGSGQVQMFYASKPGYYYIRPQIINTTTVVKNYDKETAQQQPVSSVSNQTQTVVVTKAETHESEKQVTVSKEVADAKKIFDSLDEKANDTPEDKLEVQTEVTTNTSNTTTDDVSTNNSAPANNNDVYYSLKQQDPEEFMYMFEKRAREVVNGDGENYQHVLMNILGDQLDEMQYTKKEQRNNANNSQPSRQVALEEIADNFAKKGVRMRIYNRATANYKSKNLMPVSKVNRDTAWMTYGVAFVLLALLAVFNIKTETYMPFIVTAAILLIPPIVFTLFALVDNSRKSKPDFNFKLIMIVSSIIAALVILISFGLNIFGRIELTDFPAVSRLILIPTVIALLLPTAVLFYNWQYKKY